MMKYYEKFNQPHNFLVIRINGRTDKEIKVKIEKPIGQGCICSKIEINGKSSRLILLIYNCKTNEN